MARGMRTVFGIVSIVVILGASFAAAAPTSAPPAPTTLSPSAPSTHAQCTGRLFNNTAPSTGAITALFTSQTATQTVLNVPPRFMWGWGGNYLGYCGSMSVQSVALYYGSWISEQFPRYAARNGNTQILIGDHSSPGDFARVAGQLGLVFEGFQTATLSNPQAGLFANWAQAHIQAGHPVIGGLYEKLPAGDPDYDHIVPLIGFQASSTPYNLDAGGAPTNVTALLYNDLYLPVTRLLSNPLVTDRANFSVPTYPDQPYAYALPTTTDYGVAVIGIQDDLRETYRTKLTAWSWTEPDWGDEDKCNDAPQQLNLSVAVYGLTAGASYAILRFDGNTSIPTKNFLTAKFAKRIDFVATSSIYTQSPMDTIMTNTVASYRTVLVAVASPPTTTAATTAQTTVAGQSTAAPTSNATTVAPTTPTAVPTLSPPPTSSSNPTSWNVSTTTAPVPTPQPTDAVEDKPGALYLIAAIGGVIALLMIIILIRLHLAPPGGRGKGRGVVPSDAHRIPVAPSSDDMAELK